MKVKTKKNPLNMSGFQWCWEHHFSEKAAKAYE